MKIIREKEKIETTVGELKWGDIFYYKGSVFRLEFPFGKDDPHYFNLSEAEIEYDIPLETKVTKVTFVEENMDNAPLTDLTIDVEKRKVVSNHGEVSISFINKFELLKYVIDYVLETATMTDFVDTNPFFKEQLHNLCIISELAESNE